MVCKGVDTWCEQRVSNPDHPGKPPCLPLEVCGFGMQRQAPEAFKASIASGWPKHTLPLTPAVFAVQDTRVVDHWQMCSEWDVVGSPSDVSARGNHGSVRNNQLTPNQQPHYDT